MTYDFLPLGDMGCPKCAGKLVYCDECCDKILEHLMDYCDDDDESESE